MAQVGQKHVRIFSFRRMLYVLAALCAAGGVALGALFYSSAGGPMKEAAFAQGKQAHILLETRVVQGKMAELPATDAPPPVPEEESPPAEPVAAPEETSSKEPALEEPVSQEPVVEDAAPVEPEASSPSVEAPSAEAAPAASPLPEVGKAQAGALPPPDVSTPLNGALNPSLQETTPAGATVPKVGEGGLESWVYYGKPDTSAPTRPVIALIVTGLGLNHATTGKALLLPEQVSLSFSPYAGQLQLQITRARAYGHEVWLDAPMEPEDYPATDTGPLTLFRNMKPEERAARLHRLLASATTYVGLVASPGEVFSDYTPMHDVAKEIKARGLLLLLRSRGYKNPETASHVHYINRSLDMQQAGTGPTPAQLLVELEASAKEHGYAIGTVGDAPGLFALISEWSATLEKKGLQLAPVTAIARRLKK